jgi:PadR family transcriptional regulator PadR
MDIQNTQSQMRKGVLEFCILSIIQQGEVYPSDTLYPLLTRLKNAGLLNYRWVESISGPPRKYFVMTDAGQAAYETLQKTWNEMATSVGAIITPKDNPIVHQADAAQ